MTTYLKTERENFLKILLCVSHVFILFASCWAYQLVNGCPAVHCLLSSGLLIIHFFSLFSLVFIFLNPFIFFLNCI